MKDVLHMLCDLKAFGALTVKIAIGITSFQSCFGIFKLYASSLSSILQLLNCFLIFILIYTF